MPERISNSYTGWKGIKFPFNFKNGRVEVSNAIVEINDFNHINESIIQILGTQKGERPISKDVGVPHNFLFKNFESDLIPYYESIIEEAILLGEKRVSVESVTVDASRIKSDGLILITVIWQLLNYDIPVVVRIGINNENGIIEEVS